MQKMTLLAALTRLRTNNLKGLSTTLTVRLYGGNVIWKDVAQRLLDNTCQQRTGRHEEDGCWPGFDMT